MTQPALPPLPDFGTHAPHPHNHHPSRMHLVNGWVRVSIDLLVTIALLGLIFISLTSQSKRIDELTAITKGVVENAGKSMDRNNLHIVQNRRLILEVARKVGVEPGRISAALRPPQGPP